ncbi:MAG: transposase [bacterium]|nr:transposase [bacterium]
MTATPRTIGKAPGKAHREGITVMQMADMFATEQHAVEWFENIHWPDGQLVCLRCGSDDAYRVKSGKPMPYRCRTCLKYFSLKTGTAMEDSKLPLKLWAWAIYLELTSLKGVSSMRLHRDLGVRQATAWFMLHRIR